MKKRYILLLLIYLIIITGCKDQHQTQNDIRSFIKGNMGTEWTYSDEKLKVNEDNSVEIVMYNLNNWSSCGLVSNENLLNIINTKDKIIKDISKITFICKQNQDDNKIRKAEYKNLKDITRDNIESYATYYDENNKKMTISPKEGYKKKCKEYTFTEIVNNKEKYEKKKIKLTGKVLGNIKTSEENSPYIPIRVSMYKDNKDDGGKIVYIWVVKATLSMELEKNNIYTFYGDIMNSEYASSLAGVPVDVGIISYIVEDSNNMKY